MKKFKNLFVVIAMLMLCSAGALFGCENKYKNMKITTDLVDDAIVLYYDQNSKDAAQTTNQKIFELTYINNTAGVILKSSGEDNLKITNVVLSTNNLGQALANIKFSTNAKNSINPNGIIILE